MGEIDIIARQGKSIVFVEVKARKTDRFGSPKESITRDKQIKLTRTALYYLKETGQSDTSARFDLVVITGDNNTPKLIKNAFDAILPM